MVEKKDYKIVGLAILFLLCWMGYSPIACRGAVVWSDDFNDGTYEPEWTVCENSAINSGSNWSAANNHLQLDQDTWSSFFQTDWGVISRPSTVAYGNWSFDFKANESLVETGFFASIEFISNNITNLDDINDWTCYWVFFDAITTTEGMEFEIKLRKNLMTIMDAFETTVPVAGWHNIDVTRSLGDWFSVYHNGSLIIQVQDTSTSIDTSEMFVFSGQKGIMIDNIVVDNEVPPDPPTPTPTPTPTTPTTPTPEFPDWVLFVIIGASAVVIIIVLVVILKRR